LDRLWENCRRFKYNFNDGKFCENCLRTEFIECDRRKRRNCVQKKENIEKVVREVKFVCTWNHRIDNKHGELGSEMTEKRTIIGNWEMKGTKWQRSHSHRLLALERIKLNWIPTHFLLRKIYPLTTHGWYSMLWIVYHYPHSSPSSISDRCLK
jgi:hypothetical protein